MPEDLSVRILILEMITNFLLCTMVLLSYFSFPTTFPHSLLIYTLIWFKVPTVFIILTTVYLVRPFNKLKAWKEVYVGLIATTILILLAVNYLTALQTLIFMELLGTAILVLYLINKAGSQVLFLQLLASNLLVLVVLLQWLFKTSNYFVCSDSCLLLAVLLKLGFLTGPFVQLRLYEVLPPTTIFFYTVVNLLTLTCILNSTIAQLVTFHGLGVIYVVGQSLVIFQTLSARRYKHFLFYFSSQVLLLYWVCLFTV